MVLFLLLSFSAPVFIEPGVSFLHSHYSLGEFFLVCDPAGYILCLVPLNNTKNIFIMCMCPPLSSDDSLSGIRGNKYSPTWIYKTATPMTASSNVLSMSYHCQFLWPHQRTHKHTHTLRHTLSLCLSLWSNLSSCLTFNISPSALGTQLP